MKKKNGVPSHFVLTPLLAAVVIKVLFFPDVAATQGATPAIAKVTVTTEATVAGDQSAKETPKDKKSRAKEVKAEPMPKGKAQPISRFFKGDSNSTVAITVGNAEGTRTPDGRKTRAYGGHSDPGNSVWNLGTFSFQHCKDKRYNCTTPEQADSHQIRILLKQSFRFIRRAEKLGYKMNLKEALNGVDLANQAPLAILDNVDGYVEHLKKAKDRGLKVDKRILFARTQAYWNPRKNRWEAPGLGNKESSIEHDQHRRMTAIARALDIEVQRRGIDPHAVVLPSSFARLQAKFEDRLPFQPLPDAHQPQVWTPEQVEAASMSPMGNAWGYR